MTEADLLERLRAGLGRAPGDPVPPVPAVPEAARLVGAGEDLVARFSAGARAVGTEVEVLSRAALAERVEALLAEAGAERVAVDELTGLTGRGDLGDPFALDAAVTSVRAAIAATGTLVIDGGRTPQSWSLTPRLHIAIVLEEQILPDLLDLLAGSEGAPQPSLRSLITGPSKTADIEGVLITGVHGPGRVIALVVRGDAG